jgi:hypothetical protein
MTEYLYKGAYIHYICRIHGLKLGMTPEPDPAPTFTDGVCTICQVEGIEDKVQLVTKPESFDGLREVNSDIVTGVTIKQ